jgi:hypothetical protein
MLEERQPIRAMEAMEGHFYRSPKGWLVEVLEHSRSRQVLVRYNGGWGLGRRTMWAPGDMHLTPAPEVTCLSDQPVPA